jgi:dipeptidyl aminopeptidase/acylaminoacyl peptidase
MRAAFFLLSLAAVAADSWPLERLYRRPWVWGTSPEALKWSRNGRTLLFAWNESGNRFLDLYAFRPESASRVRLTDLEGFSDSLLASPEEKDDRRKLYRPPLAGISQFSISDDGSRAAFAYAGEIWAVDTDGSKPPIRLTRTKAAESSVRISPDASRIAANRGGQIVVGEFASGRLWQVTDIVAPASLQAFEWSPDGRKFWYTVRKSGVRRIPLPNYSGRFVTAPLFERDVAGEDPPEETLYVTGADGGDPLLMQQAAWGGKAWADEPLWSPDSRSILSRSTEATMKKQQILVLDASTGKATVVAKDSDPAWVFSSEFGWSPDSQSVWFTTERDGFAHLYKVSARGGKPDPVTRGNFEVRGERFTHPPQWAGGWLYFSSTEDGPDQRHFYRIRPDGTAKEKLSSRTGLNDGLVTEDARTIAWRLADLDNPFDLWVGSHRVTHSPRPEFREVAWPRTRFVRFPSRDGQLVHAKILLPTGYRSEDRSGTAWPCVFFIHGAGYATSVLQQWGSYVDQRFVFNTYLANQGYVIMDLDYRGSSGYGRDWRTGVYLHMGGKDLDDVLGAVDYLRGLGNIDMQRLGIWGISYGGFLTDMALFLAPGVFRAGSSWAAVNDWENYNAGYTTERLERPQTFPEAYRRSSPILFSHKLRDALLIIHGMRDSNVLFQDAVQLSEKLLQEGKTFEHFFYPQEDHGFVREETLIDAYGRTARFFDYHLKR